LELAEESTIPNPGPGEVRIKVLAAGTGFTDTFIRRGRYPDFKGPLPFTPGYELVGVVEKVGSGVGSPRQGQIVADLCVVGGYAFLCLFQMVSIRQRPFASRSPTLQPSRCSRAIVA
jgi:NADPH:quinone reductase-like Zn-dependent oxidoreductase